MKRMDIKSKEFKFKGAQIKYRPLMYTINWEKYLADSAVTIERSSPIDGMHTDYLHLSGKDITKFIKELQTLVEFMKNDGLLVEDDEEDEEDDNQ